MGIDLEVLGITEAELQQRVVDKYVSDLKLVSALDEDGDEVQIASKFHRAMEAQLIKSIDAEVSRIGDTFVLPKIAQMIESHVIQQTNKWGNPVADPITFTEYLVKRAEEYMTERVNYDGKSKSESNGYCDPKQSRISYLIDKHLHYSIDTAVKKALADLNSAVAKGLSETVKMKIEEALGNLKITTKVS